MFKTTRQRTWWGLIGWALFSWNIGLDSFCWRQKDARLAIGKAIVFLIVLTTWFAGIAYEGTFQKTEPGPYVVKTWIPFYITSYVFIALLALLVLIDLVRVFYFIRNLPNRSVWSFLKRHSKNRPTTPEKSANDDHELAIAIVHELGGLQNLVSVTACITKLRITIRDSAPVMRDRKVWQQKYHALGFIMVGTGIQIAYGARAEVLKGIILDMQQSQEGKKNG